MGGSFGNLAQLNRAERMTWQLQHTQNYSSAADLNTFLVYFFDTYLNAKTPWAVSAHPDASAFKRSLSLTYTNTFTGGSFSLYYWVNWLSTSPTTFNLYHDATYTTTPGDLGTYTSQVEGCDAIPSVGAVGRDFKIWQSSERADASLVTLGKRIVWYWPGATEWNLHPGSPVWDGTDCPALKDVPFPYIGADLNNMGLWQGNVGTTPNNASAYYTFPVNGFPSYTVANVVYPGTVIITGSPWYSGSSRYPSQIGRLTISSATSDFGQVKFGSLNSTGNNRYLAEYAQDGTLINDTNTGDYWLVGGNASSLQYGAWNFGTTEPTF